ncbi:MAG: mannose/fructose/sorbose family PTS transporter subunit IIC [Lachnospiraceae bacterium]|nr:mannose/fructose/sorbose family PTS transporter subunit IIC [Lachnospiraceae bacterium]
MSAISIILVILVAFLAGMEGILDEFQFHQPLVACTLIGIACGHPTEGIILGGQLQLLALGWANIGAAVAPDAALASVASAIIVMKGLGGSASSTDVINTAIPAAVTLSVAGLFLTMICRTIAIPMVHAMDAAAEKGNIRGVEAWQIAAICLQGVRIAIPAAMLCTVPSSSVQKVLDSMPALISGGMAVGGGMVAAVGYAMVLNMMATKEVWPFFILGFCLAALGQLTLISLGLIGLAMALIYLGLKEAGAKGGNNGGSGDPLGDILNDYE